MDTAKAATAHVELQPTRLFLLIQQLWQQPLATRIKTIITAFPWMHAERDEIPLLCQLGGSHPGKMRITVNTKLHASPRLAARIRRSSASVEASKPAGSSARRATSVESAIFLPSSTPH